MQETEDSGKKRSVVALTTSFVVALIFAGCYGVYWHVNYLYLSVQIAFAQGQIRVFSEMEERARNGTDCDAAQALRGVVTYYPSGSKQTTGSGLDTIVEGARNHSIDRIVAILKARTGEDLGNAPERWLEKVGENCER